MKHCRKEIVVSIKFEPVKTLSNLPKRLLSLALPHGILCYHMVSYHMAKINSLNAKVAMI